jgi:putative glutamine amidotransferase
MAANSRSRPFIGINADFSTAAKSGVSFARIPIGYVDSVAKAGGIPIILPPLTKDMELDPILDRLDGIVLSGGLDLDPRRAGQPMHRSVIPMPERREASDQRLVEAIVDRQIPLLAIGVGMQHLNVVCGGSLIMHLPEEQPKPLPHFDPTGSAHRHIVVVEPNTRLDEIYGGGELRVNSAHHQAIRAVAPKMRVCAKSPDGVIEAIEAVEPDWFCIGVQWHPEADTASALDMQLFECFVQATVRQSQPVTLKIAA